MQLTLDETEQYEKKKYARVRVRVRVRVCVWMGGGIGWESFYLRLAPFFEGCNLDTDP